MSSTTPAIASCMTCESIHINWTTWRTMPTRHCIDRFSTRLTELARCAGATCQMAENAPIEGFVIP